MSTKGSWLIYLATQDSTKVFSLTVHTYTHTGESQGEWKKIRTLHAVLDACLSATESTQVKYCTQKCKSIHCVIYTDVQFPLCLLSLHSSCMQRQQRQQRDSMTKNCQVCRAPTHTHNTSRTTRLCTPTLPMFYTIGLEHIGQMAVISEYRHLSPTPYTWAHCTIHILAHWAYLYIHTIGEPNRTNYIMLQGRRGRAAGDLIGFWEAIYLDVYKVQSKSPSYTSAIPCTYRTHKEVAGVQWITCTQLHVSLSIATVATHMPIHGYAMSLVAHTVWVYVKTFWHFWVFCVTDEGLLQNTTETLQNRNITQQMWFFCIRIC